MIPRHIEVQLSATASQLRSDLASLKWLRSLTGVCLTGAMLVSTLAYSQTSNPLGSLKRAPVPGPTDQQLSEFVQDKQAAIQLGKALFWDTRIGSDNKTACASCHFQAGADSRIKNQLDPGLLRRFPNLTANNPDRTFQLGGPNHVLTKNDFPFTKHADINDASTRLSDINDVVSSQGVFTTVFGDLSKAGRAINDECTSISDAVGHGGDGFHLNGLNIRRVAPRNSPSVLNAAYNFRNFWDGRATNVFNGVDPFGLRNTGAMVYKVENGIVRKVNVGLPSSSLASQASGPPLSSTEMSCGARAFVKIGQKILGQKILADQAISPTDSVLGKHAKVTPNYHTLVAQAFKKEYWQSPHPLVLNGADQQQAASMDIHTPGPVKQASKRFGDLHVNQMEANFALFFGIALQMYESTLISDDTPFDQYAEGKATLNQQQIEGLKIFEGKGRCINCHGGAETTNASFRNVLNERLEKMETASGSLKTYDNGFYNIGVRPIADDIGVGGTDPFGNPLSETMMHAINKTHMLGNGFDAAKYDKPAISEVSVNGAFKTPGLRNVELTGPYFHNGGKSTLMQVVDFYNRGGDFAIENQDALAPDIRPLGLSQTEKESLVAFLVALTDERVRYERAPFDRPSICLPNGHPDGINAPSIPGGVAPDVNPLLCLKEVGAAGSSTPLSPFLRLSPFER